MPFEIHIRLFRSGTKIRGELRLSDQEGEKETRRVDGTTCDVVVDALSLTVTLALDPSALVVARPNTNSAPEGSGISVAGDYPRAEPSQVTLRSPATGQKSPPSANEHNPSIAQLEETQLELSGQVLAASVTSPGASLGGAFGGRVIFPVPTMGRWSIGVSVLHVQNDFLKSADSVAFGLTALAADVCPLRMSPSNWLDLEAGVVAMGGWLRANGLEVAHPDSVGRSWWLTGLRGSASLALLGALRLNLDANATVPMIHREFVVSQPDRHVGETRRVAYQVGIGIGVRL